MTFSHISYTLFFIRITLTSISRLKFGRVIFNISETERFGQYFIYQKNKLFQKISSVKS